MFKRAVATAPSTTFPKRPIVKNLRQQVVEFGHLARSAREWFIVFGEIVGRGFIGSIGSWTIQRWFSMLIGLLFFAVSTFGVMEKSLALTAGVTCTALDDSSDHEDIGGDFSAVRYLTTIPDCQGSGNTFVNGNHSTNFAQVLVLLNTNHDGTPLFWEGLRIDYYAASITEIRVDGALYANGTPIGAAITATAFSHTVQYNYAGNTYSFVISKDAASNTLKAFTIAAAPTITGGATVAVNVVEGQTAVTDLQSTDGSDTEGAGLTYTLTGGADQAKFYIDANTGVLTFVTAPDFDTPTDVGGDNVYDVQVTVTNSSALTDVQDIAVTVIKDATVEETQKVIGEFMQHRANGIANLQPDISGFVTGADGSHDFFFSESSVVLNYAGSTTLNAANQGIDDSFAAVANDNRTGNFDVWTQLHAANTNAGNVTNKLWLGYMGAHYFLSEDMLVGALVQIDYAEGTNPVAGSSVDGTGWMVGPYIAGKVPGHDINYEARASWGESYNNVSPFGTYTDRFDTERWMVSGKLTGDYEFGDITFSPNVSLAYFSEEQRSYIDSLSNPIPSQSIASGELRFGPEISKAFTLDNGAIFTPKVGISGIYTIVATSSNSALDLTFDQGNFRAQLALGLSLATIHGATIGTDLFYDGLGVENYETWGGNMSLRVPIH